MAGLAKRPLGPRYNYWYRPTTGVSNSSEFVLPWIILNWKVSHSPLGTDDYACVCELVY